MTHLLAARYFPVHIFYSIKNRSMIFHMTDTEMLAIEELNSHISVEHLRKVWLINFDVKRNKGLLTNYFHNENAGPLEIRVKVLYASYFRRSSEVPLNLNIFGM